MLIIVDKCFYYKLEICLCAINVEAKFIPPFLGHHFFSQLLVSSFVGSHGIILLYLRYVPLCVEFAHVNKTTLVNKHTETVNSGQICINRPLFFVDKHNIV